MIPLLVLGLLSGGCAAFANKADYADYRAVRLASDEPQRLLAMQHYVETQPRGRWRDSVQRDRRDKELATYENGKVSREGLELYLAAYPDGRFQGQARSRLTAVERIEARRLAEQQRAARVADERKKRDAELRRTWVTRFFGYWVKTLAGIDHYGDPIADTARRNSAFSLAFGRAPRPRCTAQECVKYYVSSYAVPVPGSTRIERAMQLILRLQLKESKLIRAELLLPSRGFSRWMEVEKRRMVVDDDPEDRAGAVDWALARLGPVLKELGLIDDALGDYALKPVEALTIDYTGERLDTTASDPSAPANVIQGSGSEGEADVSELVRPQAPEPGADMVMAPLTVGRDGRAEQGDDMVMAPLEVPGGSGGEVMVMAPLEVPGGSRGEGQAAAGAAAPAAVPTFVAPRVQGYRKGNLRIVVFSAGSEAGGLAYDGLLIEPIQP